MEGTSGGAQGGVVQGGAGPWVDGSRVERSRVEGSSHVRGKSGPTKLTKFGGTTTTVFGSVQSSHIGRGHNHPLGHCQSRSATSL